KWHVTISCEWDPAPLPPTGQEVGIDVGLSAFATCSNGQATANPRFFRREERALARAQRQHQLALYAHKAARASVTGRLKQPHPEWEEADACRAVSGEAEGRAAWQHRQKRRKVVARIHERARWRRDDVARQQSRRLVNAIAAGGRRGEVAVSDRPLLQGGMSW